MANAPCAGVTGVSGEPVFAVEENDVTITGLAITSGGVGIGVFGESTGFTATGNWIGIPMSGTNAGNAAAGIFLGPGCDDAQIGGTAAADGNVIAHNEVGLDIEGASEATVQGNWFGQLASGGDPEQANKAIEITDHTLLGEEDQAEDNEIGATVDSAAQASAKCDGGCNVISGAAETGIDLVGDGSAGASEAPATGPTTIHGNYIGLDGAGTEVRPNDEVGVEAGAADGVTVGGMAAAANFFAGGEIGVASDGGNDFEARNNQFGFTPAGAAVTPQAESAIALIGAAVVDRPIVAGNEIRLGEEGGGIDHRRAGATILENTIKNGEFGITSEETVPAPDAGSQIQGNTIEDTDGPGIFVDNPSNDIVGNTILRVGESGVEAESSTDAADGNLIGGDSPGSENTISGSSGFAIMIRGTEGSRSEIGRNHGSGNEGDGPFILLRPIENVPDENDPNGVKAPNVESAGKAEASGKAEPSALVRIFFKASPEEGELGGFLGEAVADANGNWKVSYAAQPEQTLLTATQTLNGGTSGLAESVKTPVDPPAPSGCPAVPSACPPPTPPPPPPDTTKPKVTIKKAPKAKSTATTAKFVFSANESGSRFKCKLDNKAFANCKSPKTYKKLKPGRHVFKVKATDVAGNTSAVITRTFTVLPSG